MKIIFYTISMLLLLLLSGCTDEELGNVAKASDVTYTFSDNKTKLDIVWERWTEKKSNLSIHNYGLTTKSDRIGKHTISCTQTHFAGDYIWYSCVYTPIDGDKITNSIYLLDGENIVQEYFDDKTFTVAGIVYTPSYED